MNEAILITGASSGIGFEFAHVLSEEFKYDLVLVARRLDRLEALKGVLLKRFPDRSIHCFSVDLQDEQERIDLITKINSLNLKIAILVNNAGFGSFGDFIDSDINRETNMLRLNCEALIHLSHAFLPSMVKRSSGAIINVSSMASFQGLPYLATYAATKAFVTSFSLGLSAELKGKGIKIQALCPGPVATEFVEVSGFPEKISVIPSLSARKVAEISVSKLKSDQRVVIPGFMNFILAQLNRIFPRAIASDIARSVLANKFNKHL